MRATALVAFAVALSCAGLSNEAAAQQTFDELVQSVVGRPELADANIGVEVYSLDRKATLFAYNSNKLFWAASTTKAVTAGVSLALLGPDYRFRTVVYRSGPLRRGVVEGDLILVASGDPNLSGRMDADGKLRFGGEHSYGGFRRKLYGEPDAALEALAKQIAAAGIRRVNGRVLIDDSLFPEGDREEGTGVIISPVAVNDNVVDVIISPTRPGERAAIRISPTTPYLDFTNAVTTTDSGGDVAITQTEKPLPGGRIEVVVGGRLPAGQGDYVSAYAVGSPRRFATSLFIRRLQAQGVAVREPTAGGALPQGGYQSPESKVAEFVSAPLREDVELTLKMSQNLHAAMMPYVLGALLDQKGALAERRGFRLEKDLFRKAGLDTSGAAQAWGHGNSRFSPAFMVRFLAFIDGQPYAADFRKALPTLAQDGTLSPSLLVTPAAKDVIAKAGTSIAPDLLNNRQIVQSKGLVGYSTTPSGERVAFAVYLNNIPVEATLDDVPTAARLATKIAGGPVAEIAAATRLLPIRTPSLP